MVSENQLAWLAGLLEGEGSFMMISSRSGRRTYRYPVVTVNMTDRDVIERVAEMMEVSVYDIPRRPNRKPSFRAHVSGTRAAALMKALLPLMGERRSAKIEEVLSEYGEIESTEVRRRRSCAESGSRRWELHGTRTGRLEES